MVTSQNCAHADTRWPNLCDSRRRAHSPRDSLAAMRYLIPTAMLRASFAASAAPPEVEYLVTSAGRLWGRGHGKPEGLAALRAGFQPCRCGAKRRRVSTEEAGRLTPVRTILFLALLGVLMTPVDAATQPTAEARVRAFIADYSRLHAESSRIIRASDFDAWGKVVDRIDQAHFI